MTEAGIGAPVRRKEDHRFITGQGRYVDDLNRPGQAHAYFVRSPHAHARIAGIDASAARTMPGVLGIFTGDDLAADKVGGLICGWMIHSKDGSPMKAGPHPALAQGKVRYVGDHVAVVARSGLAIHAAAEQGASFIVKGLRTPADFEIEQQMALTNYSVSGIRTVYLPCRADLGYISSRFVREIARYGGSVTHMVPQCVADALAEQFPAEEASR